MDGIDRNDLGDDLSVMRIHNVDFEMNVCLSHELKDIIDSITHALRGWRKASDFSRMH